MNPFGHLGDIWRKKKLINTLWKAQHSRSKFRTHKELRRIFCSSKIDSEELLVCFTSKGTFPEI